MIVGKIIGALLGWFTLGPAGAILGLLAGHFFDRGLSKSMSAASPENLAKAQAAFFRTAFTIMGRLAKADGRISEEEISHAESIMTQLGLDPASRQQAIQFFQEGAKPDFIIESLLPDFKQYCAIHANLNQLLLEYLVSMALADGQLHSNEEALLKQVANSLGFAPAAFERLLEMLKAQERFRGETVEQARDKLSDAYHALGVTESASDQEIKKAYRKLMSEHHPDKLIAQGVPEEMIKLSTEKSQEIQTAYDLIKKSRKR